MITGPQGSCSRQRGLRLILASSCFLITSIVAMTTWYATIDSNSYLDIARFVSERNWAAAINPFWGLSYAWILGLFFSLLGRVPLRELLAIRLANVLMLLFTVMAFDYLLGGLLLFMRQRGDRRKPLLDERSICFAGYALLLWSCFCLNFPSRISPDMLVTAIFFVASSLLLRIAQHLQVFRNSVLFALTLVAGYYTKAVYVPLGLVFLCCWTLLLLRARRLWPALPASLLVLAAGCAPYYRAVARQTKGVPNAATLNYAWHVNDLWYFEHWHGEGENVGRPIHPTKQITHGLRAYSFAEPIHATYAPWYDPSYFYAGFRTSFIPANEARTLKETVPGTLRELGGKPVLWIEIVCLVVFVSGRKASSRRSSQALMELWPMVVPSLAGCAIYLAVHMELRYIQPMVCCLMLALLSSPRKGDETADDRFPGLPTLTASQAMAALMLTVAVLSVAARVRHVVDYVSVTNPLKRNPQWILAERLHTMDLPNGSRVAVIGSGVDCLWAFLDDMRVVAEVPRDYGTPVRPGDADAFWTAPAAMQREVLAAFENVGADFVIADPKTTVLPASDWFPIKDTGYYYHALGPHPQSEVMRAAGR